MIDLNIYLLIMIPWAASFLIVKWMSNPYWLYAALVLSWFPVVVPLIMTESFLQVTIHFLSFAILVYLIRTPQIRSKQLLSKETQPKLSKLEILAYVIVVLTSIQLLLMLNSSVRNVNLPPALGFELSFFGSSCLYVVLAAVVGALVRNHFGLLLMAINLVNACILGANLIPDWYSELRILLSITSEMSLIIFALIVLSVPSDKPPCATESLRLMRG